MISCLFPWLPSLSFSQLFLIVACPNSWAVAPAADRVTRGTANESRFEKRARATQHTQTHTYTQAHSHTGYRRNASLSLSLSLPPASHQLPLRFNFTRSYFPYTLSAYMCLCVFVCVGERERQLPRAYVQLAAQVYF